MSWCGPTGPGSPAGSPVWAPPCWQAYSCLCACSAMEVSLGNPTLLFPRLTVIVAPQGCSRPWQDSVLTESLESGSIRHWGCSLPLLRTLYSKGSLFRVIPGQMPPAVGRALAQQRWSHLKA